VRALASILFCALLVLGQTVLPLSTASAASASLCRHCACGGNMCCMGKPTRDAAPSPAAPGAPLASHAQPAIAAGALALPARALVPAWAIFSFLTIQGSSNVPLYEWNCAYLI